MFGVISRRISRNAVAYVLLALAIMGPMLAGGFVLTLDMVFTPKIQLQHGLSNSWLFYALLHVVNFVLPGQVIEKLLIFIILFMSGWGAHRLIRTESVWPRYLAGILFTINTFTYERWMAGQYLVLFGYALLPWLLRARLDFVRAPGPKTASKLLGWFCLLAVVSIHIFVMAVFLSAVLVAIHLISPPSTDHNSQLSNPGRYRQRLLVWSLSGLSATILINSYWLLGVLRGTSPISQTINSVTSNDIAAYTTTANPHVGLVLNVFSGYGFWLERFGRYHLPNGNVVIWLGLFAVLLALVLYGVWARLFGQGDSNPHLDGGDSEAAMVAGARREALGILIAGVVGGLIAGGIHMPLTGGLTRWGIEHLPLMRGFREPEKWSALLMLAYAYFAAYGLAAIEFKLQPLELKQAMAKTGLAVRQRLSSQHSDGSTSASGWRPTIIVLALLLPFAYMPSMLYGFAGQLRPVHYPASWYQFNHYLADHPAQGKLLFLPWHEYMSYDFSPRVIANPAPDFFYQASVISGSDAQVQGIPDIPDATSRFVTSQILQRSDQTDLGQAMARLHVQYVLLADGYDAADYLWLNQQHDLRLLSRGPGLSVYSNQDYHD